MGDAEGNRVVGAELIGDAVGEPVVSDPEVVPVLVVLAATVLVVVLEDAV
jgi:hypothetical protein